jgi:tetratricopeptide (TPR) repeat protein
VEEMLEDVREALATGRKGNMAEGSNLLERAYAIAESAFGESGESALYVRYLLAVSCFNAGRYVPCVKHIDQLLRHVDITSPIDRFELRILRADALRKQELLEEAAAACAAEPDDTVEEQLELLAKKAWLISQTGTGKGAAELNEAAALSSSLEEKSKGLAKHSAAILAMQGLLSLQAGDVEKSLERGEMGQKTIEQWRTFTGDTTGLGMEMGDALTVQGKALLEGKKFLRAEEILDEALSQYGGDNSRSVEAMLALGQLFRETNSNTYAEGTYRKLLSLISRKPTEVAREHVREAYDKYAWFLRNHSRQAEAEEVEEEYIRLFHNKS